MGWQDRVQKFITMTSPDGDVYEPNWKGNSRDLVKKLGLFNYPGVDGTGAQDHGTDSFKYPLTIYFSGKDHDIDAEEFVQSCFQKGPWEVDHPTKGLVLLQLMDLSEKIEPVESGNITVFETNWLEPLSDEIIVSEIQLEAQIEAFVFDANSLAIIQFANMIQDAFAKVAAVKAAIKKVVAIVKKVTSTISSIITEIDATMNSIQRGIDEALNAIFVEPFKIAAQIQELIQLPGRIITDFSTRMTMYTDMVSEFLGLRPDSNDVSNEAYNTVLVVELAVSAVITVTPSVGATSPFKIRTETIEAMNSINDTFLEVTNSLDEVQANFEDVFIDDQYFSQSQSFTVVVGLTALSNQLLIQKTFSLAIQKTILLKKPKTPLQITVEEYGEMGDNDSNLDLFLESNNLYGEDILLLQAGREVVIYG